MEHCGDLGRSHPLRREARCGCARPLLAQSARAPCRRGTRGGELGGLGSLAPVRQLAVAHDDRDEEEQEAADDHADEHAHLVRDEPRRRIRADQRLVGEVVAVGRIGAQAADAEKERAGHTQQAEALKNDPERAGPFVAFEAADLLVAGDGWDRVIDCAVFEGTLVPDKVAAAIGGGEERHLEDVAGDHPAHEQRQAAGHQERGEEAEEARLVEGHQLRAVASDQIDRALREVLREPGDDGKIVEEACGHGLDLVPAGEAAEHGFVAQVRKVGDHDVCRCQRPQPVEVEQRARVGFGRGRGSNGERIVDGCTTGTASGCERHTGVRTLGQRADLVRVPLLHL
eukprot:2225063-Prymnesium_polylepis.1